MEKILGVRFLLWTMILLVFNLIALSAQSDSSNVLTYQEYLENIVSFHPIAKKADLKILSAKAELLGAKGNLDPMIVSDWNEKNFGDKLYFRQYQAKLKFPTKFGFDLVGGYENSEGVFLNPENKTDDLGLWHLGIEIDVFQGLLVNERKAILEQAQVFQNLADNERQIILNDLIYIASIAYLNWQQFEYSKVVLTESKSIAQQYFNNTKQSFFSGEKTAMDTLEALLLSQDATTLIQKNELGLIKSRQRVENFLWYDDLPISLQEETKPEDVRKPILPTLDAFENLSLVDHPILLSTINKLSYLEIEQKLKRSKMRPKFKVKYNPLLATSPNSISPSFSLNDYKFGIDLSMPLLLRSARANARKGELKIKEVELDLENKRNQLMNKIEGSWLQQVVLREQLILLEQNVESYKLLLDGESEKYNFGESSVFLLNKRQEKYINGQLKLVETFVKQQLELLNCLYFSNQLVN